jgi:hypothetical protein
MLGRTYQYQHSILPRKTRDPAPPTHRERLTPYTRHKKLGIGSILDIQDALRTNVFNGTPTNLRDLELYASANILPTDLELC